MTDEELVNLWTNEFRELVLESMPEDVDFDIESWVGKGSMPSLMQGLIQLNARLFTKIKFLERDLYGEVEE